MSGAEPHEERMKKTTLFKSLVTGPEILLLPVAHDPLCAKIAQKSGFKAVASAGYANSAAMLGSPDVSILTLTEMVDCARRIVDAVDLPVFADGDTGHGNTTNVARTVRLHERAGVAALFLEDQVAPKRCGHMSGKQIIPVEEMTAKIKAAVDARVDPDFTIMARTDALGVVGIEDAIFRACRYVEAGADFIFVEAPESEEQMRRIIREVPAPHMANMVPGGKTPLVDAAMLRDIGFSLVAFPTVATYVVARAVSRVYERLAVSGSLAGLEDSMMDFDEFNALVGLQDVREAEERYYDMKTK